MLACRQGASSGYFGFILEALGASTWEVFLCTGRGREAHVAMQGACASRAGLEGHGLEPQCSRRSPRDASGAGSVASWRLVCCLRWLCPAEAALRGHRFGYLRAVGRPELLQICKLAGSFCPSPGAVSFCLVVGPSRAQFPGAAAWPCCSGLPDWRPCRSACSVLALAVGRRLGVGKLVGRPSVGCRARVRGICGLLPFQGAQPFCAASGAVSHFRLPLGRRFLT